MQFYSRCKEKDRTCLSMQTGFHSFLTLAKHLNNLISNCGGYVTPKSPGWSFFKLREAYTRLQIQENQGNPWKFTFFNINHGQISRFPDFLNLSMEVHIFHFTVGKLCEAWQVPFNRRKANTELPYPVARRKIHGEYDTTQQRSKSSVFVKISNIET